ncbi:MAG: lipopolysaccharide biosynthesis protein [Polyangiaceae bacterium]|nr:lipopolysaccharide biosynthesis protein [Polyangiaceae bacterium]
MVEPRDETESPSAAAPAADRAACAPEPSPDAPQTAVAASVEHCGQTDLARRAGRGGLAVAFAKIYFMLTGLVQQILLARVMGIGGYGALSNVLSIASIAYNPVTTTSIQGVSRAVAQSPDAEQPAATRRALKVHFAFALPLGLGFLVAAAPIGRAINAPHLVGPLQLVSGIMLFYGLYTPLIGVLNGQKRFVYQAGFDILAATLRTVGLVAGAWYFTKHFSSGVAGATGAFVVVSGLMFVAALSFVGLGRAGVGGPSVRQHLLFLLPLAIGQVLLNLLLQADLTLLRTFAADAAARQGLPLMAADPLVGAYRATQLFCFLPYQLLLAITFVLFPLLATAWRDGDAEAVKRYVRTGVRLALVIAGGMVSVTAGLSGPLLRLVFPAPAPELGTEAMELLTLGFGAFAIFGIFTTILNSLKRERASMVVTALGVALVALLCWLRVHGQPFGAHLLLRTATATSAGLLLATLAAAALVKSTAGAVAPVSTVVRVLGALAIAVVLGRSLPYSGKLMTLVYSALVGGVYVVLLVVTRELTAADVGMVRAVVSSKKAK